MAYCTRLSGFFSIRSRPTFHIARGYTENRRAAARHLTQCLMRAPAEQLQFRLAHRPLHAEQQPTRRERREQWRDGVRASLLSRRVIAVGGAGGTLAANVERPVRTLWSSLHHRRDRCLNRHCSPRFDGTFAAIGDPCPQAEFFINAKAWPNCGMAPSPLSARAYRRAVLFDHPQFTLCPRQVLRGDAVIVGPQEWRRGSVGQLEILSGDFPVSLHPPRRVLHPAEWVFHDALPNWTTLTARPLGKRPTITSALRW
jgi:hypothetical protein